MVERGWAGEADGDHLREAAGGHPAAAGLGEDGRAGVVRVLAGHAGDPRPRLAQ